jgi:hypothetical protein
MLSSHSRDLLYCVSSVRAAAGTSCLTVLKERCTVMNEHRTPYVDALSRIRNFSSLFAALAERMPTASAGTAVALP